MKRTREQFIEKAKEIHGDKYDYSKVEYINSKQKVCIICPEHGEFWQTPDSHLNHQSRCPKCSIPNRNLLTEDYIKKAIKIHGDKYDYSKVIYNGVFGKVTIICPIHGEFEQIARNHLRGYGCDKCARIMAGKLKNDNAKLNFLNKVKERIGDKYDLSESIYVASNEKIKVICHHKDEDGIEHGAFYITPSNLLSGFGCYKCAREKLSLLMRQNPTHKIYKKYSNSYDILQKRVEEKYGKNTYIIDKEFYLTHPYKIKVFCTHHKEYFFTTAEKFPRYQNSICPKCLEDLKIRASLKLYNDEKIESFEHPTMDKDIYNRIINGEEVWLPIKNHEENYMISSNGAVMRINRKNKNGKILPNRLILTRPDKRSLRAVNVCIDRKQYSIHKKVFETFYNINIPKGYEYTIDHIDTNPLNNCILNLRLCKGIKENMLNPLTRINMSNRKGHKQKPIYEFINYEGEEWVPCLGYEGIYSISNFGRVVAEERILVENNTNIIRKKKKHLMRLHLKDNTYWCVSLTDKNGKRKTHYIHKLEYESFYGKIQKGNEVDHIDSNSQNNMLCNLKECSHKDNCNNPNSIKKRKKTMTNVIVNGRHIVYKDNTKNEIIEFLSIVQCASFFKKNTDVVRRFLNGEVKKPKWVPIGNELYYKETHNSYKTDIN